MQPPDFAEGRFRVHLGDRDILNGSRVDSEELWQPPELYWQGYSDQYYTIIMGHPIPGSDEIFVKYMLVNIPGSDLSRTRFMISDASGMATLESLVSESDLVKIIGGYSIALYRQGRVFPINTDPESGKFLNMFSMVPQLGLSLLAGVAFSIEGSRILPAAPAPVRGTISAVLPRSPTRVANASTAAPMLSRNPTRVANASMIPAPFRATVSATSRPPRNPPRVVDISSPTRSPSIAISVPVETFTDVRVAEPYVDRGALGLKRELQLALREGIYLDVSDIEPGWHAKGIHVRKFRPSNLMSGDLERAGLRNVPEFPILSRTDQGWNLAMEILGRLTGNERYFLSLIGMRGKNVPDPEQYSRASLISVLGAEQPSVRLT